VHWRGVWCNLLLLFQLGSLILISAALLRTLIATQFEMAQLNRCPICNYSLAGLRDPVCPECGTAVKPLS
jgi:hypothetical protein